MLGVTLVQKAVVRWLLMALDVVVPSQVASVMAVLLALMAIVKAVWLFLGYNNQPLFSLTTPKKTE